MPAGSNAPPPARRLAVSRAARLPPRGPPPFSRGTCLPVCVWGGGGSGGCADACVGGRRCWRQEEREALEERRADTDTDTENDNDTDRQTDTDTDTDIERTIQAQTQTRTRTRIRRGRGSLRPPPPPPPPPPRAGGAPLAAGAGTGVAAAARDTGGGQGGAGGHFLARTRVRADTFGSPRANRFAMAT